MNTTPLEKDEQIAFVQWLEVNKIKFTSIPNSTWTPSIKQKQANIKAGLRAGLPDLLVLISQNQSKFDKALILFIEMKRQKGSTIGEGQKEWIEALNEVDNVQAQLCYGANQAIAFVQNFLK